MNKQSLKTRLKRYIVSSIALTLIFSLALPSWCNELKSITQNSSTIVQVSLQDLKEVTVYTEALEAENATLKQSLESERAAVSDMIKAQEDERLHATEYANALNAELQKAQAENKAVKRKGTVKNCLIVGLTGALIAVIATR